MNGILLINKPNGISSFGVVKKVRYLTGEKKCGHTGTLDPLATGLLPILLGKATKVSSYLLEGDKRYTAKMKFGLKTDSYDITGNIIAEKNSNIELFEIENILPQFLGEINQIPPAFSAIKVDGKKLYQLARKGQKIEVPARKVNIYDVKILSYNKEEQILEIDVFCSKGTYIRSLCNDIGEMLGVYGTMTELERTKSGRFSIDNALSLEDLEKLCEISEIEKHLITMDDLFDNLPKYNPPDFFAKLLKDGQAVEINKLKELPEGKCTVYYNGVLLGLGEIEVQDEKNVFKIKTHL